MKKGPSAQGGRALVNTLLCLVRHQAANISLQSAK